MNILINIKDIISFLGTDVIRTFGVTDGVFVRHLKPVESVDDETLDWIGAGRKNKQYLAENSPAKVILCDPEISYSDTLKSQGKTLIQVRNPKLSLSLIADRFFVTKEKFGIHPSAVIHPSAKIADNVFIAAHCSLGNCEIGEGSRIFPNVTVYDGVSIGKNVVIHAGAVIGTDGLGCERKDDGELVKFTHLGGVIIHDHVEIGANCQVARGALSNTIIGNGVKINGLTFIAHNCILGKNVLITGHSMLAGSVKVEENATIYSHSIVRQQKTIGKGAVIGMGSVVISDVPPGETWVGNPAKKLEK